MVSDAASGQGRRRFDRVGTAAARFDPTRRRGGRRDLSWNGLPQLGGPTTTCQNGYRWKYDNSKRRSGRSPMATDRTPISRCSTPTSAPRCSCSIGSSARPRTTATRFAAPWPTTNATRWSPTSTRRSRAFGRSPFAIGRWWQLLPRPPSTTAPRPTTTSSPKTFSCMPRGRPARSSCGPPGGARCPRTTKRLPAGSRPSAGRPSDGSSTPVSSCPTASAPKPSPSP